MRHASMRITPVSAALFGACLVVLSLSSLLSGCAPAVRAIGPEDPKIYHTMLSKDPVSLDPMMAQDIETQQLVKALFDGLVDYDAHTLAPVSAVASKWESDSSGKEWTFHLRKDVAYHVPNPTGKFEKGGQKNFTTAGDFKFAWSRVASRDGVSPFYYLMEPIVGYEDVRARKADELEGIEVVDDYTLKVKLRYPFADFPRLVGHVAFSPINERMLDISPADFSERPIGNGPFQWADWRHGSEVILDRFEEYYGKLPKVDRVSFAIYPDEEVALEDFRQGALDETQVPTGALSGLRADPEYGELLQIKPTLSIVYYGLNQSAAPLGGSLQLRQAFSRALDVNRLALSTDGSAKPAASIVPSAIFGAGARSWPHPFDPGGARALMAGAGHPGGRNLSAVSLGWNQESGHSGVVAETIRELGAVGIDVSPRPARFADYTDELEKGSLGVFLSGWVADYPSPDAILAPLFQSQTKKGVVGTLNLTRFKSAEIDQLIAQARGTMDRAAREALYQQAEARIAAAVPIVPLYELQTRRVIQPWVKGYIRTAFDDTPLELVDIERRQAESGAHDEGAADESQGHEGAAAEGEGH